MENTRKIMKEKCIIRYNHGGKRVGAGRKLKYGEPTKLFRLRVPISKFKAIERIIKEYLKKKI